MPDIFVFGSNKAGIHGAGAASFARQFHRAEMGVGEGRTGYAYALPTKDENIEKLPWKEIDAAIGRFCDYARKYAGLTFNLTPVGTGLAGWPMRKVLKSLKKHKMPDNVYLSSTWVTDGDW